MKYIIHVDGDAFFASCEISRRPDLKGKPVVVGEERGIASAYTYEAKALGITRGMPIFQIRKEYPQVIILSAHFELYEGYQKKLVHLLKTHADRVEAYSIDECFAEIEFSDEEIATGTHMKKLQAMKNHIQDALGITLSFGLATTKTLGKIASKKEKPDGCVVLLDQADIDQTLANTHIGSVWGIGRETTRAMTSYNLITAKEFIDKPLKWMEENFSKPVIHTWHELQGRQYIPLEPDGEDRKSIQSTRSLTARTKDRELLFSELSRNIELACAHMAAAELYTNRIYVFYRCIHEYGRYRKSVAIDLESFTQDPSYILKRVKLHEPELYDASLDFKSTGITLSNLRRLENIPRDLFEIQNDRTKDEKYLKIIQGLQHKFGSWAVVRASSLQSVQLRSKESALRDKKDVYEYGLPLPFMGEVF